MSRFRKLTHTIWHCQYHIVWVPKYRYRVLSGPIGEETYNCIQVFSGQANSEVIELNVQSDHVHLITMVPSSPNLMIFITDGDDSTGNTDAMIEAASLATGAEVFAIGVGSSVSDDTLDAIATDPNASHVFDANDFADLLTIIDDIVVAVYGSAALGSLFTISAVSPDGTVVVSQILIPPP